MRKGSSKEYACVQLWHVPSCGLQKRGQAHKMGLHGPSPPLIQRKRSLYTFSISELFLKLFGIKASIALSSCRKLSVVFTRMEWSATSATNAYLDTLKLCGNHKRRCDSWLTREPGSNEFISALAAGNKAKLIVEVTPSVSPSTIALAAAARHTGGRLVCIIPEPVLAESKEVIKNSGLKDIVEFKTGDPSKLLSNIENIDFSVVDCKNDEYTRLLRLIDVNPRKSVVVANNLVGEKKGLGGQVMGVKDKVAVRSMKRPIGKGMEITMIGKSIDFDKKDQGGGHFYQPKIRSSGTRKTSGKSKWIVKVDENSGEEHIYRVPNSSN